MKLNFNHEHKRYTLCTVKEFADALGKMAANEPTSDKLKFIADFVLTDCRESDPVDIDHMKDFVENASCWFGIKELGEVGFNDTDKHFVFDFYGGGDQMMINSFPEDCLEEDCSADILKTLRRILLDVAETWCVLVQWDEDECITRDRKEEIQNTNRAIEDAAVTNFAEMLRDYIEGLDGEGMGVEDLKDKLYEYLNWDKSTRPNTTQVKETLSSNRRIKVMNKRIAQEAINQYNEVKSVIEENKGKTIEELYEICSEKFHRNVFNFDGELFDIELDRIEVTVMKVNGVPTLLNLLDVDVSKNLDGDWECNCTIEAIKNLIAPSKIYKKQLVQRR